MDLSFSRGNILYGGYVVYIIADQRQRKYSCYEMDISSYTNVDKHSHIPVLSLFLCQEVGRALRINDILFILPCTTLSQNAAPH